MTVIQNRLQKLREEMRREGIDAYIIVTDDFHGSEYVGNYFKAREYMSGFTGSAGTLVVTDQQALLWTDGRYFIQAEEQLSGSGIRLMKMWEEGVPDIPSFLKENLPLSGVIGFDGRTVTCAFVRKLDQTLSDHAVRYAYEQDLVGRIWPDRPALSCEPVWELGTELTGMSIDEKLAAVRSKMADEEADVLIITALDEIAWLLNLRGGDIHCCPLFLSYLILRGDRVDLYIQKKAVSQRIRTRLESVGVFLHDYQDFYRDLAGINERDKVMTDSRSLNYAANRSIPAVVRRVSRPSPVEKMKAVKNPAERRNFQKAHVKDGVAMTRFIYWLKHTVGKELITERSAAAKLLALRAGQPGFLYESFDPIIAYGPHGAIVHYFATPESDAALEAKGLLLADTGGHYREGSTDVTRTVALGALCMKEKEAFTRVLMGHLDLAAARFPYGVKGAYLDAIAREPLWEVGMDYNHGTGHGVGYLLNVHEGPNSFSRQTEGSVLEEGMVTSDEPGFYAEGQFGVRHESLLLCVKGAKTPHGQFMRFENLTVVPFDREAILTDMLTELQRETLNDYHQRVYRTVAPYLPAPEAAWLAEVTAPL